MSLALQARNAAAELTPQRAASQYTINEIWDMATWAAKGGMFPGVTDPQAAVTLMLLCRADGLDPIDAIRRFHIIKGRPSMRADAIQASFQESGGVIKIVERSAIAARAMFSHPRFQPDPVEIAFTIEDAKKARLTGGTESMYDKYPTQMLWARLISTAITAIAPGIKLGYKSVEELQEEIANESPAAQLQVEYRKVEAAVTAADVKVYGWDRASYDDRPYSTLATAVCSALTLDLEGRYGSVQAIKTSELHAFLANKSVQAGLLTRDTPTKASALIAALDKVYKANRDWLRTEVNAFAEAKLKEFSDRDKAIEKAVADVAQGVTRDTVTTMFQATEADPDDVDYPPDQSEPGSDG